jgi:glycosyltransferase involved in cell wall biosynthesis
VKVCLIAPHYQPEFEGGTEKVVRAQARALAARGHRVRVVAGSDRAGGGDVRVQSREGIEVIFLGRKPEEVYGLHLERPRLLELCLSACADADLCHVHHWFTLSAGLVQALVASMRSRPVVLTLHDLFATCPRFFRSSPLDLICPPPGAFETCARCIAPELPGRALPEIEAELFRRAQGFRAELDAASALLAPSRFAADSISALLAIDRSRIAVLPHGLCQVVGRTRAADPWNADRPLRLAHFGNLSREKGTLFVLELFAALPRGRFELTVAGKPMGQGVEAAIESAGGRGVRFAGPYGNTEAGDIGGRSLADILGRADLALFPSQLEESYALVLDEAFALGQPAWVSDKGALPQRVGSAGRALPLDQRAWSAALEQLWSRPADLARERAALPDARRAAPEPAEQLEALYERLVRSAGES